MIQIMISIKPTTILQRKMYYDRDEKERDGFYPQLSKVDGYSETIIFNQRKPKFYI